jgi:hypothetical protein
MVATPKRYNRIRDMRPLHPYLLSGEEPHLSPIVWINGFPHNVSEFIRTDRDAAEERKARQARRAAFGRTLPLRKAAA